jgi:GTPase Era involved in 16S rRNA processing
MRPRHPHLVPGMNDKLTIPEAVTALPGEPRATLTSALGEIHSVLALTLPTESSLAGQLRSLRERLEEERLQLSVLGQFKRGKSTFINALLGADLLPTSVIPLTAVATFISWRPQPLVVIRFQSQAPNQQIPVGTPGEVRNTLFRFVAEEANPENRLGVERVDLLYPADILREGSVIIDTPGIGSTLQHNTEAALRVLPECDAAIFVLSADPPITDAEIQYLRRLKSKVSRVLFVVNKIDYLRSEETRSAEKFLTSVLVKYDLMKPEERLFCVSARNGLNAKQKGNAAALEASGIAALEKHLVGTLAREKNRLLEDAIRRKTCDICMQASAELDLRERTLKMPIDELIAKSEIFREALGAIEEQRPVTADLLASDHRRLREALDVEIDRLKRDIVSKITEILDVSLVSTGPSEETLTSLLSGALQKEFGRAQEAYVKRVTAEAGAVLERRQECIEELVDKVHRAAADIFDIALSRDVENRTFVVTQDPYWVTENHNVSLIPDLSRATDLLLPNPLRQARKRKRIVKSIDELVVRNAENLRWSIIRGLDDLFRKSAAQFEERLEEAFRATRNIITDALSRREDQFFDVQPELDRVAAARASLIDSCKQL